MANGLDERGFEELLCEAVDEGMSSLGESGKQATYYYLDKGCHLTKQEIPCRVEDFANAIEKFFGLGAHFLEILILKQLYEKVGVTFKQDTFEEVSFVECVAQARQIVKDLEGLEAEL